jgi:hypothetical protein
VVTSTRSGQLANDAHARNRASVFTHHLVEGLRFGAKDHDEDGVVNLSEVYDYVYVALADEGKQVPQKRFEGDGDVPMALRTSVPEHLPQVDLVAPTVAEPRLDVSDSTIDLGEIDADEELPPERIAVINRGGGTLDWTVQTTATWVQATAEEAVVVLHLRPQPGPNRANVHVRDLTTGAIKTIRVSVRVRDPAPVTAEVEPPAPAPLAPSSAPEASPPPTPALEASPPPAPAAQPTPAPAPPPPASAPPRPSEPARKADPLVAPSLASSVGGAEPRGGGSGERRLGTAAAVAATLAGVLIVASGVLVSTAIYDADESLVLFRGWWGPGILNSTIAGVVLVAVGAVALTRRDRRPCVAAAVAIAAPLAFVRIAENAKVQKEWGWIEDTAVLGWFSAAGLITVAAAAVGIAYLACAGVRAERPWASSIYTAVAMGLVALWGVGLAVDVYDGGTFGDSVSERGPGSSWQVVAALTVGLTAWVGLRLVERRVGAAMLMGAAVVPLSGAFAEAAFLIDLAGEAPPSGPLWIVVLLPAALLLVAGATARRAQRQEVAAAPRVP